jgi:putative heme iron utilization protein
MHYSLNCRRIMAILSAFKEGSPHVDIVSQEKLARLIGERRIGALGTLRDGAPFVSMIAFAPAVDFSVFYILASQMAYHTQDFLKDPRCSLLITETDSGTADPQMLGRLTVRGKVESIGETEAEYENARELYVERFPNAARTLQLGDFALYRIRPDGGRFVAGFGQTFNCTIEDFKRASVHRPHR